MARFSYTCTNNVGNLTHAKPVSLEKVNLQSVPAVYKVIPNYKFPIFLLHMFCCVFTLQLYNIVKFIWFMAELQLCKASAVLIKILYI